MEKKRVMSNQMPSRGPTCTCKFLKILQSLSYICDIPENDPCLGTKIYLGYCQFWYFEVLDFLTHLIVNQRNLLFWQNLRPLSLLASANSIRNCLQPRNRRSKWAHFDMLTASVEQVEFWCQKRKHSTKSSVRVPKRVCHWASWK